MTPTLSILPLGDIAPSRTNPRKHFDQTRLEELAASIRESGVHTPVLVRPLPAHRLEDTAGMDPRPQWELIAGERRLRASAMAGVATIPALVRAMTDGQVLEAQIVENLQRDDLTELEEAEGYEALMQHGTAEDGTRPDALAVANKIGKSKSYVYARLKLLDLCTEARDALRAGKLDGSRALLIARIPDGKLQIKALAEATITDFDGQPSYSARSFAHWCQQNVMLRLDTARFNRADSTLVPAAGPCATCPKRTGANPDLFADVKAADVCTDPACFRQKEDAHHQRTLQQATERGQTIITGREAKALIPNNWSKRVEGHLRLDSIEDSPDGKKTIRQLVAKHMEREGIQPVLIEDPHAASGTKPDLIAVLPHDQAAQLLRAAGRTEYADDAQAQGERKAKQAKAEAAAKAKVDYEAAWRMGVVERVGAHISTPGHVCHVGDLDTVTLSAALLRHITLAEARGLRADPAKHVAKLLGLGKVAPHEGIRQHLQDCPADQLPGRLLLLLAVQDTEHRHWLPEDHDQADNPALHLAAELCSIDIDTVQADARAELKAQVKAKAAKEAETKAKPGETKAVKAETKGVKTKKPPKTTATQAQQGIAQALQAADATADPAPAPQVKLRALFIGQRVQVNSTASRAAKAHIGRLGRVSAQQGDCAWHVLLDPRKRGGVAEPATFDRSELEAVEA